MSTKSPCLLTLPASLLFFANARASVLDSLLTVDDLDAAAFAERENGAGVAACSVSSPWRAIFFDQADDERGQVPFAAKDGNETGGRIYWHNKATAITSDAPGEASLFPALWGMFEFR